MITKFKIFENNETKFKVGDSVYILDINENPYNKGKITKVLNYSNNIKRYITDQYPNATMSEDYLKFDYEIDAEKYNL